MRFQRKPFNRWDQWGNHSEHKSDPQNQEWKRTWNVSINNRSIIGVWREQARNQGHFFYHNIAVGIRRPPLSLSVRKWRVKKLFDHSKWRHTQNCLIRLMKYIAPRSNTETGWILQWPGIQEQHHLTSVIPYMPDWVFDRGSLISPGIPCWIVVVDIFDRCSQSQWTRITCPNWEIPRSIPWMPSRLCCSALAKACQTGISAICAGQEGEACCFPLHTSCYVGLPGQGRWHWPVPWVTEPSSMDFHGAHVHPPPFFGWFTNVSSMVAGCISWVTYTPVLYEHYACCLYSLEPKFSGCEFLFVSLLPWLVSLLNITAPFSSDVQGCYCGGRRRAVLYGRFRGGEQETRGLCTPRIGRYHRILMWVHILAAQMDENDDNRALITKDCFVFVHSKLTIIGTACLATFYQRTGKQ